MSAPFLFSDEHARLVNELLLDTLDLPDDESEGRAMAAYRVGIASAMAIQGGVEPTRNLLETCANAESGTEAVAFSRAWVAHAQGSRAVEPARRVR